MTRVRPRTSTQAPLTNTLAIHNTLRADRVFDQTGTSFRCLPACFRGRDFQRCHFRRNPPYRFVRIQDGWRENENSPKVNGISTDMTFCIVLHELFIIIRKHGDHETASCYNYASVRDRDAISASRYWLQGRQRQWNNDRHQFVY